MFSPSEERRLTTLVICSRSVLASLSASIRPPSIEGTPVGQNPTHIREGLAIEFPQSLISFLIARVTVLTTGSFNMSSVSEKKAYSQRYRTVWEWDT